MCRPRIWLAAAAVVAVLIGGGYGGWLLVTGHQRDVAVAQALTAAEEYALTLTTIDPDAIDRNFADMDAGATGEFAGMHAKSRAQLRQLLIDQDAEAHGAIVDAAVKSATRTEVANGGTGSPATAPRGQQIRVAKRILAHQGPDAWPSCLSQGRDRSVAKVGSVTHLLTYLVDQAQAVVG